MDQEIVQIIKLRYVKFICFTVFYLNQSSYNQKSPEEKKMLLCNSKMLDIVDDDVDLFSWLSESMYDEFKMIDSSAFVQSKISLTVAIKGKLTKAIANNVECYLNEYHSEFFHSFQCFHLVE